MMALLLFIAAGSVSPVTNFPMTDLSGLFTIDDYPSEALRKMQEGTVNTLIEVDASGAIVNCTIAKSSGTALLDETTCAVIRSRAHYEPLLPDTSHRKLVRKDHVTIKWVIPRDARLPVDDAYTRFSFDLSADAKLSNCAVELNGKPWQKDACEATVANFQKFDQQTRDDFASRGKKFAFLDGYVLGADETGSLLPALAGAATFRD